MEAVHFVGQHKMMAFENVADVAYCLWLLGPISRTDLSLATYHFILNLSPKTDLSLFVKSAPGHLDFQI